MNFTQGNKIIKQRKKIIKTNPNIQQSTDDSSPKIQKRNVLLPPTSHFDLSSVSKMSRNSRSSKTIQPALGKNRTTNILTEKFISKIASLKMKKNRVSTVSGSLNIIKSRNTYTEPRSATVQKTSESKITIERERSSFVNNEQSFKFSNRYSNHLRLPSQKSNEEECVNTIRKDMVEYFKQRLKQQRQSEKKTSKFRIMRKKKLKRRVMNKLALPMVRHYLPKVRRSNLDIYNYETDLLPSIK